MIKKLKRQFENKIVKCHQYIKCGERTERWMLKLKGQCMKCEIFQFGKGQSIYKKLTQDIHDCPICLEQEQSFKLRCQHYVCWKYFYDLHYYQINEDYMFVGSQFDEKNLKYGLKQGKWNSLASKNHENHVKSYNKKCFYCVEDLQEIICHTHVYKFDPTCPCCYEKYRNHYLEQHDDDELCELCLDPSREDQNKLYSNLKQTSKCPLCRIIISEKQI